MSSTAFVWLRRFARHARQANGANVTVTFALATVPLVGFVGAAVDYSHASSVKAAMQAAADGTALMLSRSAASMTQSDIQTKATDYFNALFNRPEATGLIVTTTYTTDGRKQDRCRRDYEREGEFHGPDGRRTDAGRCAIDRPSGATQSSALLWRSIPPAPCGTMTRSDALKIATKSLFEAAQGRRRQGRRRLRVDHSVQQGRQFRQERTTRPDLDPLGSLG